MRLLPLLVFVSIVAPLVRAQAPVDTAKAYRIVNANSGLDLAIAGDAVTAGTAAIQAAPDVRHPTRLWHFVPEGNGNYLLENLGTGAVLGISFASHAPNTPAVQWADNATPDHLWQIAAAAADPGLVQLVNFNSGLPIGVVGDATTSGAAVEQLTSSSSAGQQWRLVAAGAAYPDPLRVTVLYGPGDTVGTHDPAMIRRDDDSYLYATHGAIHEHQAHGAGPFEDTGTAMTTAPAWTDAFTNSSGDLWAPSASFRSGRYWLYFAASTFGSGNSAIGLATATNPAAGHWVDSGAPILTSADCPGSNAIDPAVATDSAGTPWMSFGSFANGIYIVRLDPVTGKVAAGATCQRIAARLGSPAIEGSAILHHGGYYYLLVSYDFCCRGVDSTYHIAMGRSKSIDGPYVDRGGLNMVTDWGGTLLLTAHGRIIGPGGESLLRVPEGDLLVYHYYDPEQNGLPALGLNLLHWTPDGWPTVQQEH